MKTLPQKVNAVLNVFKRLDDEISTFQNTSGLRCISGCGECCKKPDIEATPLEFLPLALEWYDLGKAESMLEQLERSDESICAVFRPHVTQFGGLCSEYPNRGLICRLFGYSARRDKNGHAELVTCKLIKANQPAEYRAISEQIAKGEKVPMMTNYYSRLSSIDHDMVQFYPINTALRKAIETILHYYAYRKRRKKVQS